MILIGYLHVGGNDRKSAALTDVGRTVGLDPTLVSRNNAPLAALGLLESAENRRWRLTEGGVTVARALEYEVPEDARDPLAELLRSNDYIQGVVAFIRAQGGVDEEQVVSHMARAAGVKRTSEFLTGARAILGLMYLAGLVEPEGDTVRVPPRREAQAGERASSLVTASIRTGGETARWENVGGIGRPPWANVAIHLNVSPSDLKTDAAVDALAARIKRLLDALASG